MAASIKLGVLLVGVLIMRALPFNIESMLGAPDFSRIFCCDKHVELQGSQKTFGLKAVAFG